LIVAKRSARQARVKALTQIRNLVVTAPDQFRCRSRGLSVAALVLEGAMLRPSRSNDVVTAATKASISSLAHRIQSLQDEIARIDELLTPLVNAIAPELLDRFGIGIDTAATLLVTAGDNPDRLHSESAWAHLCGVSPLQASSGKTTRHRLDRGGDRQANHALWRIVMVRLSYDDETKGYMQRRVKEGRSKPEVIRILKRYVARAVYRNLPRA
jgi:transposase